MFNIDIIDTYRYLEAETIDSETFDGNIITLRQQHNGNITATATLRQHYHNITATTLRQQHLEAETIDSETFYGNNISSFRKVCSAQFNLIGTIFPRPKLSRQCSRITSLRLRHLFKWAAWSIMLSTILMQLVFPSTGIDSRAVND